MTTLREALALAGDHHRQGRLADAAGIYRLVLSIQPHNPVALNSLALLAPADEAPDYASRARQAAKPGPALDEATALDRQAAAHIAAGRHAEAAECYRQLLDLRPNPAIAAINQAAALATAGQFAAAATHRAQIRRPLPLLIETAATPQRTVLIPGLIGKGNIPNDALLPASATTRIIWFVEFTTPAQAAALPPYDVAFNAIGDPDALDDPTPIATLHANRPVLNPPSAIAQTRRDRLPTLLAGIPNVICPATIRVPNADLAATQPSFPCLLRPIAAHGGQGAQRIDTQEQWAKLPPLTADAYYITKFHDFSNADGYYRKYRVIYVDRVAYAYHLAISPHWLVHYFSADMLAAPWKREEERVFLEHPAVTLGPKAAAAITEIGERLDLDFAGIDFTLTADGQILVFEANATMLVHLNDNAEDFPYKHAKVPAIFVAFNAMLDQHATRYPASVRPNSASISRQPRSAESAS